MLSALHVFSSHWSFGMGTIIMLIRQMKKLGFKEVTHQGSPSPYLKEEPNFEPKSIRGQIPTLNH